MSQSNLVSRASRIPTLPEWVGHGKVLERYILMVSSHQLNTVPDTF